LLDRILHPRDDEALDHLSITSPQVARHWNISNSGLQLNWHDVYGRLPSFHSSFANDISENAWNRFWGIQGLGRFASQPTCSWNSLFTDRSHFPWQDDWFSVKTCSQQRQRPIFCQPVVVPPPPFRRAAQNPRPPTCPEQPRPSFQRAQQPVTQNNNGRVNVGCAQAERRPDNPLPPVRQESPVKQGTENHVRVGYARTERRPDDPSPSVRQEQPAPNSNGNRVRVGYAQTGRRPDDPSPSVGQAQPAPGCDGNRVRVGYAQTGRRPDDPSPSVGQAQPAPGSEGNRVRVGYASTQRR